MGSIKAFIEGILHGGKKKKTSSSTGVKKYSYIYLKESRHGTRWQGNTVVLRENPKRPN